MFSLCFQNSSSVSTTNSDASAGWPNHHRNSGVTKAAISSAEGKRHSLVQYRGKVIVMDFWATWCGPCAKVMPRLQKLHEKLADKGVVVIGINSWEKSDPVALMKQKRYSYGLLLNGEQIAEAYKVTTLPVVYIVGLDGKIIYCHEGQDQKDLSAVIEKYFKANGIPKTF